MRLYALPLFLIANTTVLANGSDGDDWPGWRGPAGTGISTESTWSSTAKAKPLWEKQLGLGHASFAVVGERVYTLGFDEETSLDTVFCLDVNTGEEHWSHTYPSVIWDLGHDGGASTTPAVVDGAVYTSNREGRVFCFDAASGEVRWQRDLSEEMGLEPPKWGFSASPLPMDDVILLNFGKLIALDRTTGEDTWVTERDYGIAYSTPALFNLEGKPYIALLNGDGLAVLNSDGGTELDFFEWIKQPQIYPMTPVVIGDRIFISGGYDRGCAMLRLADGKLEELWGSRAMRNKMSGCILWDNHLIGFDESILKCIDLDGKMMWRKRGLGTGSMSIAGGRMVILDGKGQLIVAEANSQEYVELSRQKVHEGGTSWSTPVLSHGRIFARSSLGQMVCLDNRSSKEPAIAASTSQAPAAALPDAMSLVSGHVNAVGGAKALAGVKTIQMTGPGESLRNTVEKGAIQMDWSAEDGFSWLSEEGFRLAFLADIGWQTGRRGPEMLKGDVLDVAREGGTFERLFDPATTYSSMTTVARTVFDNRPCYAVAAKTAGGAERTIYFEIETGLFAGHQGEGVTMWTFGQYQSFQNTGFEDVMLPTKWTFYEPVNGEMNSAIFESATINVEQEEDPFEPPVSIKMLLRTPEEIAADNIRLAELHANILGKWTSEESPPDDPGREFLVENGYLVFTQPDLPPSRMSPRAEDGSISLISASYVVFRPEIGDDGVVTAILVYVGDDLRVTLIRL